jgi:hypothetical protein
VPVKTNPIRYAVEKQFGNEEWHYGEILDNDIGVDTSEIIAIGVC